MTRRREIKLWYSFHAATQDYYCEQCGETITATMEYSRRVFVHGKRLEVERQHESPDCVQIAGVVGY